MTTYRHETSVHGFAFSFIITKLTGNLLDWDLSTKAHRPDSVSSVFRLLLEHSYSGVFLYSLWRLSSYKGRVG